MYYHCSSSIIELHYSVQCTHGTVIPTHLQIGNNEARPRSLCHQVPTSNQPFFFFTFSESAHMATEVCDCRAQVAIF